MHGSMRARALQPCPDRCTRAPQAEIDVCSVVLMGGIAAEALRRGGAEGGAADERALARLMADAGEAGAARAQARRVFSSDSK